MMLARSRCQDCQRGSRDRAAASRPRPARLGLSRWRVGRGELIGEGVARFVDPGLGVDPSEGAPPFPAYVEQPRLAGDLPDAWIPRPVFSSWRGRCVIDVPVAPGTSLYGTGEQAGALLRNGTRTVLWNTDAFAYDDRTPSLYQSHPFVLGVDDSGGAMGVIVETTRRCVVDLRRGVRVEVEGPPPRVAIIRRSDPASVVSALVELTGRTPMPPMWALGFHQCRWSYEPEGRVRQVAMGFRRRAIPADVIWLDIDYMDGFRCFTHDRKKFPSPRKLNEFLHRRGFKAVYMIDPGLKVDPAYAPYAEALREGHFIKDASGAAYVGKVWPGPCSFPDFTRARVRRWWAGLYKDFMSWGIDGVWNDMNEPAVFETPGKTMPDDNRHDADEDLGGPGEHARYHNIYGMQMVRATREGVLAANPSRRPFVLTRANFLGGHRYAATWTGDNASDWRHLRWSIPMALNLGLSGQAMAGPDIGGFAGDADGEMFARWMGIGALLPFCRAHSIKESGPHEPWAFGEACERACRAALQRRYRLLPYLYTLVREAGVTGLPVVRPLFFADPADVRLRAADDAFLLGESVLVSCDATPAGRVPGATPPSLAPLPRGVWREFEPIHAARGFVPGVLPRLFLREGAAVALGPVIEFVGQRPLDPLTLVASLDESGEARAVLYEDEGDGHGHEKGKYALTTFVVRRGPEGLVAEVASREGRLRPGKRKVMVVEAGETLRSAGEGGGEPVRRQSASRARGSRS